MERWHTRICALVVIVALSACDGAIISKQADHALVAGEAFSYQIQPLVEADATVSYKATLADGRVLPGWLNFDPQTLRFSGTAPERMPGSVAESLNVQVIASDASGTLAKTTHSVRVMAATTTVPQIVNPAEELQAFAPTGILRWSAVTGADAFEVWAYKDSGLTQLQEFSKALVSRQYQFTQLAADQTFYIKLYYRVSGSWMELPAFSIRTTSNVNKARLTNSQEELDALGTGATLRWTTVQGADVYELWVYRDANLEAFAEASGPVRITQYQITSLTPGSTYYVQVYSKVNGVYTVGGPLTITVTGETSKARIVNPQEELDAFATNGMLRWSAVTGATAYELWIFTNPNSSEIYESSGSLTTRSYSARTLQPGSVYYAQAYAFVSGQWQVGAPVKITTTAQVTTARLTTPQEELEGLSTTGTLRWTEVPGATAYELWIYGNAGLGTIIEHGANPDHSYQPKKLCSGAVYYIQVFALINGQWTTGWATRLDVTQGTSAPDCVPPAPQVRLTASPLELASGESVGLTWATQFATSCTASGAWSGAKALSGQETVGPLTKKSLFTLICTGQSGTYKAEALVVVQPPPDPLFANQWHLRNLGQDAFASTLPVPGNDLNVADAWASGYTGRNIKVAIIDSGLEVSHEDLQANVDRSNSYNFITGTNDPSPAASTNGFDHGTSVAGIVAATAFNGTGGRGVAYAARLRGYNLLAPGALSLANMAIALGGAPVSADNDVFNASWHLPSAALPSFSGLFQEMAANTFTLRGGLGAALVTVSGNQFQSWGDPAVDPLCGYAQQYHVSCGDPATDERRGGYTPIVVGAINADGKHSSYSNTGSSLWVSAPGGEYGLNSSYTTLGSNYDPAIVTTSRSGCANSQYPMPVNALDAQGANPLAPNCQYTATMNGTSSAAPNVAGVIAMMLDANPKLSVRDIKYILAKTARKTDPTFSGVSTTAIIPGTTIVLEQGWTTNAAGWSFSNRYGFGAVDASAAVTLAKTYTTYTPAVPPSSTGNYGFLAASPATIPALLLTGSSIEFQVNESFQQVEAAIVFLNIATTPDLRCNQVELRSPSGTKSILIHAANGFGNSSVVDSRVLSNAFYGEQVNGTWRLTFYDFCPAGFVQTALSTVRPQILLLTGR